jgi:ketosteroid isomerase-like protein
VKREVGIAMKTHLVAVLLAGCMFGGCTSAPPAAVAEAAAGDSAAVESTTAAFHQALRTNDLERFMNYVADDLFFMPPGEPPVRGRGAVRQWITRFLTQYRTSNLILADREVFVGGRWAVEVGTFEWALQPAAGGAAVVDRGNYMQVWKQQDDKTWRFAREVYNSSVPIEPVGAK